MNRLTKASLYLSNTTTSSLVFKVKTTNPKLYCARPNSAVVPSGETLTVSIIRQPMEVDVDSPVKEKFLIMSTSVTEEDLKHLNLGEFWSNLEKTRSRPFDKQKLNVHFIGEAEELPAVSSKALEASSAVSSHGDTSSEARPGFGSEYTHSADVSRDTFDSQFDPGSPQVPQAPAAIPLNGTTLSATAEAAQSESQDSAEFKPSIPSQKYLEQLAPRTPLVTSWEPPKKHDYLQFDQDIKAARSSDSSLQRSETSFGTHAQHADPIQSPTSHSPPAQLFARAGEIGAGAASELQPIDARSPSGQQKVQGVDSDDFLSRHTGAKTTAGFVDRSAAAPEQCRPGSASVTPTDKADHLGSASRQFEAPRSPESQRHVATAWGRGSEKEAGAFTATDAAVGVPVPIVFIIAFLAFLIGWRLF